MCLKTSVDERKRWVEEGRGVLEVWDLQMTLQKVCYKAVVGNVIIHVRWCARVAVSSHVRGKKNQSKKQH